MNLRNQVPGKYLCGHSGMLTGSGRYGRIQEADRSYLRHNICSNCNKDVQSLIDAARANTAALTSESGLKKPTARGTPKQEPWANAIIAEVFPLLAAVAAAGRARGDELGTAVARAISLVCHICDAGFWIKQQDAYRVLNSYCLSGDVADILRKACHSYQGTGTSWLAGLVPCTGKPDRHYKFAQKALLNRLISEPTVLDAAAG
ncbi:TPA: hypothetical protein L4559_005196 [Pseudomonas aeruginosa]|nr:hypothetical protein [Pseudomonas aeruginosa]